ncbi:MAG TPA: hypothetical protein VNX68_02315, partial [Nitrosopumilaceae archaeon]|nr:hypothetical protein [Nitrosopumilaceae archaeon]
KIVEDTLSTIKSSGQDGNLKNIKGDLFEFLMYPVLPKIFANYSILHGKKLSNPSTKEGYEYDFIVNSPDHNETTVIELKGYLSTAKIPLGDNDKKNTASWFFGKTFPFAKKILSTQLGNPKVTGCYITSAGFQDDAKKHMESLNGGKIKPREMDTWYDREKLLKLLEEKGLKKVKTLIERYYQKDEEES